MKRRTMRAWVLLLCVVLLAAGTGAFAEDLTVEAEPGAYEYLVESAEHIDARKLIFQSLARAGYPVLLLKNQDLSLEDVFIRLTADKKSPAKGAK